MKKIPLHIKVIIGLLLGAFYAFLSVKLGWNDFTLNYIKPFGDIFINIQDAFKQMNAIHFWM